MATSCIQRPNGTPRNGECLRRDGESTINCDSCNLGYVIGDCPDDQLFSTIYNNVPGTGECCDPKDVNLDSLDLTNLNIERIEFKVNVYKVTLIMKIALIILDVFRYI